MDKWKHLFKSGEFARRDRIVSGLTLEQVTRRPSAQSHTIYEELWHTNRWQSIMVYRDEALYEEWQKGHVYPPAPPASQAEWDALVAEFLAGLDKALWWTESRERLKQETDPGSTMANVLVSLATHTAHHLGKIIALRQFMDAWEAEPKE
ncbi:MAG: DinB family protein [Pyrinomonadaceae bacterium]